MNKETTLARTLIGTVTSNKMKDSIVVMIERRVKHAKYGKFIKRSTKIHAHDAGNQSQIGDLVMIKECRPISKTKSWTMVEIKEKAEKES
jgi:small subunit ribosomal protein S17